MLKDEAKVEQNNGVAPGAAETATGLTHDAETEDLDAMTTPTSNSTRKPLSVRTRFEVLKRDDFACRYCGRTAPGVVLHVDHIVAVADGGSDDPMNLVTACSDCNLGKSDNPLDSIITPDDPAERAEEIREIEAALRDYNVAALQRDERLSQDRKRIYESFLEATGWSCVHQRDFNWLMSTVETVPVEVVLEKIQAATVSGAPKRAWIPYIRVCIRRWKEEGR